MNQIKNILGKFIKTKGLTLGLDAEWDFPKTSFIKTFELKAEYFDYFDKNQNKLSLVNIINKMKYGLLTLELFTTIQTIVLIYYIYFKPSGPPSPIHIETRTLPTIPRPKISFSLVKGDIGIEPKNFVKGANSIKDSDNEIVMDEIQLEEIEQINNKEPCHTEVQLIKVGIMQSNLINLSLKKKELMELYNKISFIQDDINLVKDKLEDLNNTRTIVTVL